MHIYTEVKVKVWDDMVAVKHKPTHDILDSLSLLFVKDPADSPFEAGTPVNIIRGIEVFKTILIGKQPVTIYTNSKLEL